MEQPSLKPCWVKVARSQAHFDTLDAEIRSFLNTRPYGLVLEPNEEINGFTVRAEALQEPTAAWSVVIGDCVHNLRAALDYLVWQLAWLESDTPGERLEFPITYDPAYYADKGTPKIEGVPELAAERIEAMQPYPGRDDWRQDLLVLHDLDRFDKHRFLQVTGYVLRDLWLACATTDGRANREFLKRSGPFEDGEVVARVGFTPLPNSPNAKMDVRPQVSFDVAFDERQSAAANRLVLPTLIACMNAVRRVLREFDEFFA